MSNQAIKWTDAELERVERELTAIYQKVYNEILQQFKDVAIKWEFSSEMTPQERYLTAQKYNRLNSMLEQISKSMQDTNREAMKIINGSNVNVFVKNYNYSLEVLEEFAPNRTFPVIDKAGLAKIMRGEVTPFTQIALDNVKDRDVIVRNLTRELTSGIMQGESIPKLARRIKEQTNKNLYQSTRIARTETNRIQNAGHQEAGDQAEKMGLHILKVWVSTKDDRTRESHKSAKGMTVPNSKPFIIGNSKLMFPSDQVAAPEESINCRCTIVHEVVTKKQYDYVVEQYEKGNYFPDWKSIE